MKYLKYLSLLFILNSCTCKVLEFEDNETFWTDVYEKGDKLIFQSSKDTISKDTITILDKEITIPSGDCNPMVSLNDPEAFVVNYNYNHNGKKSDSDYFIQHVKEEDGPSLPILRVYGTEFSGNQLKDTTIITKKYGKLNDCYTFSRKGAYNGWSEFKIKTFVWSKKLGLVVFVGLNKEKYELCNRINKAKLK